MRAVDERAMAFAASDDELRAAMFRLVDVTPACRNLDDLGRHLAGLVEQVGERPPPIDAAMRAAHTKAGRVALGAAVTGGVRHMAHRFIAGATPREALGELERLWKRGIGFSADLLGEATVTSSEADAYAARCAEALDDLSAGARRWPAQPHLERDSTDPIARVNLSVKVSALTPVMRPLAPEVGRRDAEERLAPLLDQARELGAHLHVDMESVDSLETTLELAGELLASERFRHGPSAGLVLQAYLRDSPSELDRILEWARSSDRAHPLVVRLVKGAYWDHESAEARQHGWRVPVFTDKRECDRNFEALTRTPARRAAGRPRRGRLAQPAVDLSRHRLQPPRGRRRRRPRAPGAPRAGRRAGYRARGRGLPRSRLLADRRPRRGHGLPRPPTAREHLERVVPVGSGSWSSGRGAARGAVSAM